jgi:hypothetical protein
MAVGLPVGQNVGQRCDHGSRVTSGEPDPGPHHLVPSLRVMPGQRGLVR